ncbi:MAG TPA: O-methyltransferase [Candidatus Krumholzibacteria bacterium]|jgi:predicted O-methyltransferase YrrM
MSIHDPALEAYLERLAAPSDSKLAAMTRSGRERGFPIVGPQVGRFLEQQARAIGAEKIFELGSGFGYSTLWFARGMRPDGVIHHTDGDPKNSEEARRHLEEAGFADRVRFHVGDAVEILRGQPAGELFDIVFCDIDKHGYPEAAEEMVRRVRVGGLIIIDNLIWSGKVVDAAVQDPDTEGIRRYQQLMWQNSDFLSSLLPIRDGVGLHLRLK